jgi:thiol-disulfide isomerase/thioredoxin
VTAQSDPTPRRRPIVLGAAILAGLLAGLAGIYGIEHAGRNRAGDATCQGALEAAKRAAPFARGEVAAMNIATTGLQLPNLAFHDAEGRPRTLADWRGRTVLLNLWATWCAPCRQEMPALDALQAKLGGTDFEVVAVNIDTRNLDRPKAWLKDAGVSRLAYYADPNARVFQELKGISRAAGMPTTLLIDPAGCEIGTAPGAAEWASEDALRLVQAALRR